MTLNAHRRRDLRKAKRRRVWLNGVEVTNRCFYADGRRGVVRLYCVNAEGKKYLTRPPIGSPYVATEERRGRVRWGRVA